VLTDDTAITYRAGTYRTASPEDTWQWVSPLLPKFGITRVADITRLDEIGLPVHVAYRPVGRTLAVSVGTGLGEAQSQVSAVMESIETWHAENPRLETVTRAPAADLGLPYDVRMLNLPPGSPLTDQVVLDWVEGTGLLTGKPVLVPADSIQIDFTRRSWREFLFRPTTNGMATGSSALDATLHALVEVIERDCAAETLIDPDRAWPRVDPSAGRNHATSVVYHALRAVGCQIDVRDITNRLGLPCYRASIWSPDVPVACGGYGCHVDPDIAIYRAMIEAAQSRLVVVSGARDDIDAEAYRPSPGLRGTAAPWASPPPAGPALPPGGLGNDVAEVVRYCAERVAAVTGVEPFSVDLSYDEIGIPVRKVFAPGLRLHQYFGYFRGMRRSNG
jgi:YcaO-like protein with predicted kinase domain